jgi:Fe-S cluster biogenesis protein NfuA
MTARSFDEMWTGGRVAGRPWRIVTAVGPSSTAEFRFCHPAVTDLRRPRHNGGVTTTGAGLSDAERAERLEKLQSIMDLMRPAVQADGGDLVLVRADVETGVVEVQLQGACSSCAISSATLSGGVERILRERLPWVTEVVGDVDDTLSLDESAALGTGGYVPSL